MIHLSKSMRKFIREEKARIRREVWNGKEQDKLIYELYQRLLNKIELQGGKNSKLKKQKAKP